MTGIWIAIAAYFISVVFVLAALYSSNIRTGRERRRFRRAGEEALLEAAMARSRHDPTAVIQGVRSDYVHHQATRFARERAGYPPFCTAENRETGGPR